MYTQNELFFPITAIPAVRQLGNAEWQALVERLMTLADCHEEVIAFTWTMAKLNGCLSCETDSYRAMRGCASCSIQTLRRCRETEHDLIQLYHECLAEVRQFCSEHPAYAVMVERASSGQSALSTD
ncbi:MAG: hypothetical protein ACOYL5_02090 [Phototrophicaceae bacterium]